MKKIPMLLLAGSLILTASWLSIAPASAATKTKLKPVVTNWTGTWSTNWGTMTLKQKGDVVTGTYEWDNGKITAKAKGNQLIGDWTETPTRKTPNDAGQVIFTMNKGAKTFAGKWRYGKTGTWGEWTGTKIANAKADDKFVNVKTFNWTGTYETNWGKMYLTQKGQIVTGTYEHDTGKITAKVSGYQLLGTWSESPSYKAPSDAGEIMFTLSKDGKSFSGKWRYGNSGNWSAWTGTKSATIAPLVTIENPEPIIEVAAPVTSWTGTWTTEWGDVLLAQEGNKVTGTYPHDTGKINGTNDNGKLTGLWSESPTYAGPSDAGDIEWIMGVDGKTFTGNWRYGSEGTAWSGNWNGTRK